MGINASVSMSEVLDGGSQTILLAELRAGVVTEDERGVWAMANTASALWAHGGVNSDAFGPNSPMDAGDDCAGCSKAQAAFGGAQALARRGMGCWGGDAAGSQQGARSMHENGVHAGFADGSVRFINEQVQTRPSTDGNLAVWDRLNASADGQILPPNAF